MTREDGPWMCQAHPRPDQSIPGDDARRDAAAIASAIAFLLLIFLLSNLVPDWTQLR